MAALQRKREKMRKRGIRNGGRRTFRSIIQQKVCLWDKSGAPILPVLPCLFHFSRPG